MSSTILSIFFIFSGMRLDVEFESMQQARVAMLSLDRERVDSSARDNIASPGKPSGGARVVLLTDANGLEFSVDASLICFMQMCRRVDSIELIKKNKRIHEEIEHGLQQRVGITGS